jgi:hypothetical protein
MLKPVLFYVALKVLSILRFTGLSKSAVNDGKFKIFMAELIQCLLLCYSLSIQQIPYHDETQTSFKS